MADVNVHGLTRPIPEGVKREVRQRCGFGCVVCGNAFVVYDHLDPPFAEAKEHRSEGIVLLCAGCHDRKTRLALAEETVRAAARAPAALKDGFSRGPFDIGAEAPEIEIGEVQCKNVESLITIDGESIFAVTSPEVEGAPFRVSALITDRGGTEVLRIVNNEWRANSANWDVLVEGRRIAVRRGEGDISLVLRADPPRRLVVERLNMRFRGVEVVAAEGKPASFRTADGNEFRAAGLRMEGCKIGIEFKSGLGVGIGAGGGSMHAVSLRFLGPKALER